ncbi:Sister chromatid cohesion protein 2 [Mortierella claussenii]|nr:Sister chromatid cohesion protein 2 [Mortierella claussenii]
MQDPTVGAMLAQQDLSRYTFNFQIAYLKTIINRTNASDLRCQIASQITVTKESTFQQMMPPLSPLAEVILRDCSLSSDENAGLSSVYELPEIDLYEVLLRLQRDVSKNARQSHESLSTSAEVDSPHRISSEPSGSKALKRSSRQDSDDYGLEETDHASKKMRGLHGSTAFTVAAHSSAYQLVEETAVGETLSASQSLTGAVLPPGEISKDFPETLSTSLQLSQERGAYFKQLSLEFESIIARFLEQEDSEIPRQEDSVVYFTTVELKRLYFIFQETARQGQAEILSSDALSTLLRQLDASMSCIALQNSFIAGSENLTEVDQVHVSRLLDHMSLRLEHVTLSLVIFTRSGQHHELYPEELLKRSLSIFKSCLDNFMVPALEFSDEHHEHTRESGVFKAIVGSQVHKPRMLSLVGEVCKIMDLLGKACCEELSDEIVLKLAYAGISLFFMDVSSELLLNLTESERLRQAGSNLLRTLFAKFEAHRVWVLEEILSLLIKLPHGKRASRCYRLADGSKIHSSSALLMHLVQACRECPTTVPTPLNFPELDPGAQRAALQKLGDDLKAISDAEKACVAHVFNFLLSRCTKGTKSSLEADYRTILESFVTDLLTVLGHPEWPSAELCLFLISKAMARYRSVIDYLGVTMANDKAAKGARNCWICEWLALVIVTTAEDHQDGEWKGDCWEAMMNETSVYWKIIDIQESPVKISSTISRDAASQSSAYLASRQQLFLSFDIMLSRILVTLEGSTVTLRAKSLKALSSIVTGDYAILTQQNVRRTIALRLQDQSPAVRDAATDLVGKYMLQDAGIRKAYYDVVSDRISDTGLNVRKRVLRLLRDIFNKAESSALRIDISQKLLLRVSDDEATVKDLAIRSVCDVWFGSVLEASKPLEHAHEANTEVSAVPKPITPSQRREISRHTRVLVEMVGRLSAQQDEALGLVVQHILRKERVHHSLDLFSPGQEFAKTCVVVVDCLVDLIQTLQDEDASKSTIASALQTLHLIARHEPRIVMAKHVGAFLAYLHCSATSEDWRITMYVLRIYQNTIPFISDVTSSDSQTAEKLVLALAAKCPIALLPDAVNVLCSVVRVWTRQPDRLCKFFQTCMNFLHIDTKKLKAGTTFQESKTRRLIMIVSLICRHFPFNQLLENCPEGSYLSEFKAALCPTAHGAVFEILIPLCERGHSKMLRQTALQSLGHLYMSYPALMNVPDSLSIMDAVFADQDIELKAELLRIYSKFLVNTQNPSALEQDKETAYSLIAKAEDHLDAGMGSAIMQRYLDRILQCALANDTELQVSAIEVISQVTAQALVHPISCMPTIVALEGCEDLSMAGRASRIHEELHHKHASLIYSRNIECARMLYMYRARVQQGLFNVQGFRITDSGGATALLAPMYSLVSEKRQTRITFLSALVKVFDVQLLGTDIEVDGNYIRFLAENLAYLEYRSMEEIYLVLFHLNRIIAGTGMTLLYALGRRGGLAMTGSKRSVLSAVVIKEKRKNVSTSEAGADDSSINGAADGDDMSSCKEHSADQERDMSFSFMVKASVAVEAAIVLKRYFKLVYDVSEAKSQQFQPTTHGSHKEKPVQRHKGSQTRMQWPSESHEVRALCKQAHSLGQGDGTRQLARFKRLMETEAVQDTRDLDN